MGEGRTTTGGDWARQGKGAAAAIAINNDLVERDDVAALAIV